MAGAPLRWTAELTALAASAILAQRIVGPIQALSRKAIQAANSQPVEIIEASVKNEIGSLARAIGGLVEHLVGVYKNTLESHSITFRKEMLIYADKLTIESGYSAFKRLLTEDVAGKLLNFTSIITMNDLLALGIYKVANELGINIPGNYSIIGYDNIETASVVSPPLTTIHQSRKRIGKESVRILLENIENSNTQKQRICFEPYIVVRGSVRSLI